jgi:ankyrin repeat protein
LGIDIESLDDSIWSPLYIAASKREFEMVKLLIASGAKAENITIDSERFSSNEIRKYLIVHGARNLIKEDDSNSD